MFPKSIARKQLDELCRRFGLKQSSKFHGFIAGGEGYLYRRANPAKVKYAKGKVHFRWHWTDASGQRVSNRKEFQHILLHGPKHGPFQERFFILKKGVLPATTKILTLACDPDAAHWESHKGEAEMLWKHEVPASRLKEIA